MPGNRRLYEHALRRATEHSERKQWEKALAEFQNALVEFPDDLEVLEETAKVHERLGHAAEAAQQYQTIAAARSRQGQPDQAVDFWERAIHLDNTLIDSHKDLAFAYATQGNVKQAVRENLALAQLYQQQNQLLEALGYVQTAYALEPANSDVLSALERLRAAGIATATGPESTEDDDSGTRGSPVDQAREKALSDLAETIFDDLPQRVKTGKLNKAEADALITRAIDQQTQGNVSGAIDTYRRMVSAGVDMPAVSFNLGLLYQEAFRLDEAIGQFQRAVNFTEYRLGSLFALGELYRAKGQVDEALNFFLEALKIIDLQTVNREQADDLIKVYESLAETYATKGEAQQAGGFVNTLVDFLSSKGWADKVAQARRRLDSLTEEGAPTISLAEILSLHDAEALLQSLSMMQELAKRGKYYSALEEAYLALQRAPDYLPLHLRMAEMMYKNGQVDTAINKFVTIANTMAARGDNHQSMAIYQRILRLAPLDVSIRTKLIEMLVSYGQIDRALEQYMALADTYYQLASTEKAREKYLQALALAPRGTTGRLWANQIMHKLGELDLERGDWRRALQTYEQIKKTDPSDDKARLNLVELYYKVQPQRALQELDELVKIYRANGKLKRLAPILEEQVRGHPKDIGLRARVAQVCIESGLKNEGISHLNVLGELQLNAGLTQQAIATIRAIIALNPPNVQAYQKLLAQIGG
jgi:tetratricopeptide (TPR) repeat protein